MLLVYLFIINRYSVFQCTGAKQENRWTERNNSYAEWNNSEVERNNSAVGQNNGSADHWNKKTKQDNWPISERNIM